MPTINEVSAYLDEILNLKEFGSDCSNNGLQFEGSQNVTKAVFGVDACAALFMDAADADADFVFVHHGLSWGGSLKRITGVDANRKQHFSLCGASASRRQPGIRAQRLDFQTP